MGMTKEKQLKQLKTMHRTINLNEYIYELLEEVSKEMGMTKSELIRYILTKELEKMAKKIRRKKHAGQTEDTGTESEGD